jgi:pimeloyl-ACP methyl ester carboxylesterase
MPKVKVDKLTVNYDEQGTGEPLVLIPYLAADHACYAFQVADYAKHFTCISVDPRGAGETDKPAGTYSIELVAALMQTLGIRQAHVSGLSLGAAAGMWLAVKHPDRVKSLSLHSGWTSTDFFLRTVVEGWRGLARGLGSVAETVIMGILPWCLTPELYAAKPDYIRSLAEFVRGRPVQPVAAFLQQSDAVLAHDIEAEFGRITAPTQITCGRQDMLTSVRLAERIRHGIPGSELVVFEGCAHAPIYEKVDEFNQRTLAFLTAHAG